MEIEDILGLFPQYVSAEFEPLKCPYCESNKTICSNNYVEAWILCEYQVDCKDCGKKLGYWAYGGFSPFEVLTALHEAGKLKDLEL